VIQENIKNSASTGASLVFNIDRKSNQIKKDKAEILQVAQIEAEKFSKSGKFFFLPIFFLRKREFVEHIYKEKFIDTYTGFLDHYQSKHP
jgi:hypothetical protein